MRMLVAVSIACLFSISSVAAEEPAERFPYTAFVATDTAPVRSGPGLTFYPVQDLKRGDAVEVWRHDPDGWMAVRPPEGSFSWVDAKFVQSVDGRHGLIFGREVNVRVGTQFSDIRDVIQLRLADGDEVEILGSDNFGVRPQYSITFRNHWYKIAPPAGEFRWIHQGHTVRHPDQIPSAQVEAPAGDGVRQVAFEQAPAQHDAAFERLRALPPDASPTAVLNELESALSQMVTAEPTAWHFAELQSRADAIVERSETAVERSQARLFLGKLARFADIQKRYSAVAQIRGTTTEIDRRLDESAPAFTVKASEPKRALDGTRDTSRYDGVGRMTQIVMRDQSGASYALTDETGRITAYVMPAPGVNLRQFVGLEVGVNGIRGFAATAGMPQITAKRIDVLDARTNATLRR
jgi:hypothetical protein